MQRARTATVQAVGTNENLRKGTTDIGSATDHVTMVAMSSGYEIPGTQ